MWHVWLKDMAVCSRIWLCQSMFSLEMQIESCRNHLCMLDALQTLWVVSLGCRMSVEHSLRAWWEKGDSLNSDSSAPPMGAWETNHQRSLDLPIWQNFISKMHLHLPGQKRASFGLVILHRYSKFLPAPCSSSRFSRPKYPRSSALIGWPLWNVGKHFLLLSILAITEIYLCFTAPCSIEGWKRHNFSSSRQTTLRKEFSTIPESNRNCAHVHDFITQFLLGFWCLKPFEIFAL